MKDLLSKKALRMLGDNGYKFKQEGNIVVFRRATEYTSIIVVTLLVLVIASPLFIFNTLLGFLTILLGIGGIVFRYKYLTKRMNFTINMDTKKFDFVDNAIELDNQSLSYAQKILIHSKFVSEYTSSFKSTSEEHEISIRIQLLSGSMFTLFKFHSDYEKPSEEMMEVHDLIKKLIKWTKKSDAQAQAQTPAAE